MTTPTSRPPRHFSMIRGSHLADVFTLGNAACGTGSVFLAMATSIVLTGVLASCARAGRLGEALPGGAWLLGPWPLHPLALLFALSGMLMVSKTLHIPKP